MDPLLEIREIANDRTATNHERLTKIHNVLDRAIPLEEPKAPGALVQMTRDTFTNIGQTLTLMQTLNQWVVVANSASAGGVGAVWAWGDLVDQAWPGTLKIINPGYTNITQEV